MRSNSRFVSISLCLLLILSLYLTGRAESSSGISLNRFSPAPTAEECDRASISEPPQDNNYAMYSDSAACCDYETLECILTTQLECEQNQGIWHPGETCDPGPCPESAVCCDQMECFLVEDLQACESINGYWIPGLYECSPNPCYLRVCCLGEDCILAYEDECNAYGGWWIPDLGSCEWNPCRLSACCLNGECTILNIFQCDDIGGEWLEMVDECYPNPCSPWLQAVCCWPETNECQVLTQAECEAQGGEWFPNLDICGPNTCAYGTVRACCIEGVCSLATVWWCLDMGGDWLMQVSTCDPNPCQSQNANPVVDTPSKIDLVIRPSGLSNRLEVVCSIGEAGPLRLEVFDPSGRFVCLLFDGWSDAGLRQIEWDGRDQAGQIVSRGAYLCKASIGSKTVLARVLVLW